MKHRTGMLRGGCHIFAIDPERSSLLAIQRRRRLRQLRVAYAAHEKLTRVATGTQCPPELSTYIANRPGAAKSFAMRHIWQHPSRSASRY